MQILQKQTGPTLMTTLTKEKISKSDAWVQGISSLSKNAGDLSRMKSKDKKTVEVQGITLEQLLQDTHIQAGRLNILQIDAECYDAHILHNWDGLEKYMPQVINIEWSCISESEKCALVKRLVNAGYNAFDRTGKDFTAAIVA
eukprot:CFRG3758T1